ncbi:hypothetical protein ACHAWX_002806, partial [Stephanocyclus meneghinianus]
LAQHPTTGSMSKRRILVTGANSGIGLALTKQLVTDFGCHVYLGSRNSERGMQAVEEVKATAGDSVELLKIDVGDDSSVAAAAAELSQRLRNERLYAIVNNAGTGVSHGTLPAEILDTNTRGPRRVVDNFMPLLNKSEGRIVNVGSGGGPGHVSRIQSNDVDWKRFCFPMGQAEIEREIGLIEAQNDSTVAYRGSKALLACYTMALAQQHPELMISIITPAGTGASKLPHEGTVSLRKCLFEDLPCSGYFWGSDGKRSPLHFMRNPGDPEYDGALPS